MEIIMTILNWMKNNKRIAVDAILSVCVALSLIWGITTYKQNKILSDRIEIALNNIEAYLELLNDSLLACSVLKLDVTKLEQSRDSLVKQIGIVAKKNNIKTKDLNTAATQTQTLLVNKSKEVNDIIVKDSVYSDSIRYNNLTVVYYTITNDSIDILLDIKNQLYLYVFKKKEYKNKKSFLKRLFTLDFKKITRYKYNIYNTNDLLEESDIRIIEAE